MYLIIYRKGWIIMAKIEICCGSYEDALAAYKGGAKRIELNQALHLGGLTPDVSALMLAKKNTDLEIVCMVRPRAAGFCYTDNEYEAMLIDLKLLLDNGADGIAFGFLTEDFEVDKTRTKEFIDIIHSYGKTAVYHRAFDCTKDPYSAIETLIELGADRILTSGQKAKAMDGKDLIKDLQIKYGDKIELLAGSGMNATNAKEMMEYTGISQVHSSCKSWREDVTTKYNEVTYGYSEDFPMSYDVVSEELVKKLVDSI